MCAEAVLSGTKMWIWLWLSHLVTVGHGVRERILRERTNVLILAPARHFACIIISFTSHQCYGLILYPLYQLKKMGSWIGGRAYICWMANYVLGFVLGALLIPYISRWEVGGIILILQMKDSPRWWNLLKASRWLYCI